MLQQRDQLGHSGGAPEGLGGWMVRGKLREVGDEALVKSIGFIPKGNGKSLKVKVGKMTAISLT